ncbi:unnamed protein product, partial [marine sediment metagenome]
EELASRMFPSSGETLESKRKQLAFDQAALNYQKSLAGPDPVATERAKVGLEQAKLNLQQDKAGTPVDPMIQDRNLALQQGRLEDQQDRFRIVPGGERIPELFKHKSFEERTVSRLQKRDYEAMVKNKDGVWVQELGKWVDSTAPLKDAKKLSSIKKNIAQIDAARQILNEGGYVPNSLRRAAARQILGEEGSSKTITNNVSAAVVLRRLEQEQQRKPRPKKTIGVISPDGV